MTPLDRHGWPGDPKDHWEGLIVICSGTSWDGARLSDRHLAERLTTFAPVLFVDPPISVLTPLRRPDLTASAFTPGLSRLDNRLARLTPSTVPGVSRPGLRRLAFKTTRAWLRWAAGRLGGDVEAVIVGSLDDMFGVCGERQRLLWGTDDFSAAGQLMGLSPSWLAREEQRQLTKASLITAVSEPLADRWRGMGHDVTVIPNGVDTAHYLDCSTASAPEDVTLPRPIAGFVGHLSDRIDLGRLEGIAASGHSLLLVGPRQETFEMRRINDLLARPNVQWVGPKPFEVLPSYLGVMDVGVTPYADSEFNRSSYPLKTLEYLAAGLPVVSTDLPAARSLGTPLVRITSTPSEFWAATTDLLENPVGPEFAVAAKHFARTLDWSARAGDMAALLGVASNSSD